MSLGDFEEIFGVASQDTDTLNIRPPGWARWRGLRHQIESGLNQRRNVTFGLMSESCVSISLL